MKWIKQWVSWVIVLILTAVGVSGQSDKVYSQQGDSSLYYGNNTLVGDSMKMYILNDYTHRKFKKKSKQNKYDRLMRIVKKVYPLAKLAGMRMEEYAAKSQTLRKGEVEDFVAEVEDEIQVKYSADLKKLTFKEGFVLLKLLDRQTSMSAYSIVKELKSGFSAMLWQSIASFFDYDLKEGFNPFGVEEDQWIEEICVMIDRGVL